MPISKMLSDAIASAQVSPQPTPEERRYLEKRAADATAARKLAARIAKQDDARAVAREQLAVADAAVKYVLDQRAALLTSTAYLFAEFQVGEEVVDRTTGKVWTVVDHYVPEHGGVEKTAIYNVHCRFERGVLSGRPTGDNTSHYAGRHPFVRRKVGRRAEAETQRSALETEKK